MGKSWCLKRMGKMKAKPFISESGLLLWEIESEFEIKSLKRDPYLNAMRDSKGNIVGYAHEEFWITKLIIFFEDVTKTFPVYGRDE